MAPGAGAFQELVLFRSRAGASTSYKTDGPRRKLPAFTTVAAQLVSALELRVIRSLKGDSVSNPGAAALPPSELASLVARC